MRILAIIPACEGAIGMPNKNIRIVNEKPMIYYVIDTAKKSKYITDIIVSTNSPEILIIAKQMGVAHKNRNDSLCSDKVPLDPVIYDVVKDIDSSSYDYVVTIQSISPTLTTKTLDNAIERCFRDELDTLISVVNKPGLYWKREGNSCLSLYEERKNKHQLPPHYKETGAFLITKPRFITENTRIGQKVDLYVLSGNEAIEVDTFGDLKQVEHVLKKTKVAIYVNGNNTRGTGHVLRALELSDEFFSKPDIYYDLNQTEKGVFGGTTHNLISVDGLENLMLVFHEKKYDIIINDILNTSIEYMASLKNCLPDAKIINFEDDGEGAYLADLVINALYENSDLQHIKAGAKYFIAPKLFIFYDPITVKDKVSSVFISFGGADPQNYSDRLLKIIEHVKYKEIIFFVVIGRAKKNVDRLLEYNKHENINVMYNISNMPDVMTQCDIALTARGRTGYELALLGIPSISMAQNKIEEKHSFINNENGFTYLGLNPSDGIIATTLDMYINLNKEERQRYQDMLLSSDLRNGRKHVMNLINGL